MKTALNPVECIVEEKDATPEQKAVKEVNAGIYCLNWGKIKSAFRSIKKQQRSRRILFNRYYFMG